MSITYTPTTNFGAKDSLPANDPAKVIKGAEFTTEYTAIQSAFALAAPASNPTITGTATFDDVSITNGLTVDGTTLVVDDTANQVLLGTATAYNGDLLNVSGAATFSGSTTQVIRLISSSDTGSSEVRFGDPTSSGAGKYKFNHDGNIHEMIAGGVTAATFDAAQAYIPNRLGIGTATPEYKLHLKDSNAILNMEHDAGNSSRIYFKDASAGGWGGIKANYGVAGAEKEITIAPGNSLGDARFGGIAVKPATVKVGGDFQDTDLIVAGGGQVGIGTSTPGSYKLNVVSSGFFAGRIASSGTSVGLDLGTASGSASFQYYDSGERLVIKTPGRLQYTIGDGTQPAYHSWTNTDDPNTDSNNEQMRLVTTGALGIGTTSPDGNSRLHVAATTTNGLSGSGLIKVQNTTSGSASITFDNNTNDWSVGTNSSAAFNVYDITGNATPFLIESGAPSGSLRVSSTGNVGIGETAPATTLEIAQNATSQAEAFIPTVRLTNTDTTAVASDITGSFEFYSIDASSPDFISGYVRNVAEDAGVNYSLTFGTKSGNADAVEHVRINGAGNVGIGNDAPTAPLTVTSNTGGDPQIAITAGVSDVDGVIGFPLAGASKASIITNKQLSFHTGVTDNTTGEAMRITSGGSVGIGETAPGARFCVKSTVTTGGEIARFDDSGSSITGRLKIGTTGGTGTDSVRLDSINRNLDLGVNGTTRVTVYNTGQMRLIPMASAPSGAGAGDLYFDSTTNKLRCYDGTTWQDCF